MAPSSIKEGAGFVGPLASQTSQPTLFIYRTSQNELSQRTILYQLLQVKIKSCLVRELCVRPNWEGLRVSSFFLLH